MKKPIITSAVCAVGLFGFVTLSPAFADEPVKVNKPSVHKVINHQLYLVTYKADDGLLQQKMIDLSKLKWQGETSTAYQTLLSTIKTEGLTTENLTSLLTFVDSGSITGDNGMASLLDKEIVSIVPTTSMAPDDDNEYKDDMDNVDSDLDELASIQSINNGTTEGQVVSNIVHHPQHVGRHHH